MPQHKPSPLQQRSWRAWVYLTPALLWTVAFFLLPLGIMALYSLWQRVGTQLVTQLGLYNYQNFLARDYFAKALWNSLEVSLLATVISLLLAYPLAYILAERVPPRWQRLALALAVLPFWTSYLVRSYSWLLVLSDGGVINQSLLTLGILNEPLSLSNNRTATVIGFVHFFVMLLTLTIFASLVQLPRHYRQAAADLGAGPIRTFIYVIFPLTLPGVMVGAFLSFVLCMGDYITPQILGGNRELLLPQAIMLQIQRRADFPMASALSLILMAVISVVYLLTARYLRLEQR